MSYPPIAETPGNSRSLTTGGDRSRGSAPQWMMLAGWFAVYVVVGAVTFLLQPVSGPAAWYPPVAIGVAFLWRRGLRWWPLVFAADSMVAVLQYRPHPWVTVVVAAVTALEAATAVVVLRRVGFDPRLRHPVDVLTLVGGCLAAAAVGATLGTALTQWVRAVEPGVTSVVHPWREQWQLWAIGDLTGLVTLLPLLFVVAADTSGPVRDRLTDLCRHVPLQAAIPIVLGVALAATTFEPALSRDHVLAHGGQFLVVLPVLWTAVRYHRAVSVALAVAVDVAAILALVPHVDGSGSDALVLVPLQLFVAATSIGSLLVAVVVQAERQARDENRALLAASPLAISAIDPELRVISWNPACERLFGWSADEVLGGLLPMIPPEAQTGYEARRQAVLNGHPIDGADVEYVTREGSRVLARLYSSPIRDPANRITGAMAIAEDVTELRRATRDRDQLAAAIGQASEAVFVTDADANIVYVNPAVESSSGYTREELIGENPRIFKSGVQAPAFYEAMWERLLRGEAWSGTMINRRKDGSLYEEAATISPVVARDSTLIGYVSVKRDLTRERSLEDSLEREVRERIAVAEAVSHITVDSTVELTAQSVAAEALRLGGRIDLVLIAHQRSDGSVVPLAVDVPPGVDLHVGDVLPRAWSDRLLAMAPEDGGPYTYTQPLDDDEDERARQAVDASGFTAAAVAPLRWNDRRVGFLLCGTSRPDGPTWIEERLPATAELATYASALLGPQLAEREDAASITARLSQVVESEAFHPVFQPIVDVESGLVVGFEALTRFDDGTPPDQIFVLAGTVGLQARLELRCVDAAIRAAGSLPAAAWISVNASPQLLLRNHRAVADILGTSSRPVVLEVTEHVAIADYEALRAAREPSARTSACRSTTLVPATPASVTSSSSTLTSSSSTTA